MKKTEKSEKKRKNILEFRALFRFAAKMTKSKRKAKNLKQKKEKKRKKSAKKGKNAKKIEKSKNRKNRLEFRFALFHFEAKMTKVKRSEKFEAKRSEKREVKFYSETVKQK